MNAYKPLAFYADGRDCLCMPCREHQQKTASQRPERPGQPKPEPQPVYQAETPQDRALVPVREYNDVPFCDAVVKGVQLLIEGQPKDYMG